MTTNTAGPQLKIDDSELQHAYVNGANATPMADDCVLDLGTTSLVMPPESMTQGMTPDMAEQVGVLFRHTHRMHMTWPTAKRIAIMMTQMVQTYEANAGVISIEGAQPQPVAAE